MAVLRVATALTTSPLLQVARNGHMLELHKKLPGGQPRTECELATCHWQAAGWGTAGRAGRVIRVMCFGHKSALQSPESSSAWRGELRTFLWSAPKGFQFLERTGT